ncbi:kinase-like domain-containing protein [Auriculariales sp. MPI-PUGE-AT-0066]|nr:kinase-like domain-containing protein [Auriculariales sp. MPI-PUGE-AT-0066]
MAEALEFLQEVGVVHGDLKSENILVKEESLVVDDKWAYLSHVSAQLADFGCSFSTIPEPGRTPLPFNCGTSMLLAPERVLDMSSGHAGDIWSLGLSVLEWAAGLNVLEPLNCDTQGEMLSVMEKMVGKRLSAAMRDKAATCAGFVIKPGRRNRRRKSCAPTQEQQVLLRGLDNVGSYQGNVDHRHIISLCKQMLRLEPTKRVTVAKLLKNSWLLLG